MKGRLHSSLRTYIDCFLSPPFPKQFPYGGGVYEQDPFLMRDFRLIRKFELDWKESQRQMDEGKANLGKAGGSLEKGGGFNLEEMLEELGDSS